jgi:UDP-2,3-diacylglucosamine pyrophosphatase LpxH
MRTILYEFTGIPTNPAKPRRTYRSIWISDFHLGTHRCQATVLLDFLRHHEAENLYLVGDILDGWNLGRSWWFDGAQQAVVSEISAWIKRGTVVELLPGNHDQSCFDLLQSLLGVVPRRAELIHRTADDRRLLVTHGHQFDRSATSGYWLQGSQAYSVALRFNQWYGRDWTEQWQSGSLSAYLRQGVQKIIRYLTDFDDRAVLQAVRQQHADGIICGHTHRPEQRLIGPIWYINDGDWVESCTALIEEQTGELRLLRWGPQIICEAGCHDQQLAHD